MLWNRKPLYADACQKTAVTVFVEEIFSFTSDSAVVNISQKLCFWNVYFV